MATNKPALWTDDRIKRLKKLFDDGLSFSQIASDLGGGMSRNAAIGKFHRFFGDTRRVKKTPKAGRPAARPNHGPVLQRIGAVKQIRAEPFVCQDAADVVPLHLSIYDLNDTTCKWPYGLGPYTFCGNQTRGDKQPYCSAHARLSHGVGTVSERAAARLTAKQAAA